MHACIHACMHACLRGSIMDAWMGGWRDGCLCDMEKYAYLLHIHVYIYICIFIFMLHPPRCTYTFGVLMPPVFVRITSCAQALASSTKYVSCIVRLTHVSSSQYVFPKALKSHRLTVNRRLRYVSHCFSQSIYPVVWRFIFFCLIPTCCSSHTIGSMHAIPTNTQISCITHNRQWNTKLNNMYVKYMFPYHKRFET